MRHPNHIAICIAVALAAGAWGLYWIPQRALESAGMTGGWATTSQFVLLALVLAPIAAWRMSRGRQTGFGLPLIGLALGGAVSAYANSLLLTDVVHALLLFYLLPIWATVIDVCVLRRPPGRQRFASLPLAVLGAWLVFAPGDEIFPVPTNSGDWVALASGIMFAAGAARAETRKPEGVFPMVFAIFFYGSVVALLQLPLVGSEMGPAPSTATWLGLLPWLLALSVAFYLPTIGMVTWAPARIGASLVSILLLAELVFGVVSAALLSDEPFGWREALGSAAIMLAGFVEVAFAGEPARRTQSA